MKALLILSMFLAHLSFVFDASWINYGFFFWVAPAFAAVVAFNTIFHTSNAYKYSRRIFSWALVSQPLYMFYFSLPWYMPNILFGLSVIPLIVESLPRLEERYKLPKWVGYSFYPLHLAMLAILAQGISPN